MLGMSVLNLALCGTVVVHLPLGHLPPPILGHLHPPFIKSESVQLSKIMQFVWLYLLIYILFEDTFDSILWGKKKMCPMWPCILSNCQFKSTHDYTLWRKVKQMQPMWLCILKDYWSKQSFGNTFWRKIKKMQPVQLCILLGKQF